MVYIIPDFESFILQKQNYNNIKVKKQKFYEQISPQDLNISYHYQVQQNKEQNIEEKLKNIKNCELDKKEQKNINIQILINKDQLISHKVNNQIYNKNWYKKTFKKDKEIEFRIYVHNLLIYIEQNNLYSVNAVTFNKDLIYFANIDDFRIIYFNENDKEVNIQNNDYQYAYVQIYIKYSLNINQKKVQLNKLYIPTEQEIIKIIELRKKNKDENTNLSQMQQQQQELPDGLYLLAQLNKISGFTEILLETLNSNITFCHLNFYFVQLLNNLNQQYNERKKIEEYRKMHDKNAKNRNFLQSFFDIDINCLYIYKKGFNIRFIYIPDFKQVSFLTLQKIQVDCAEGFHPNKYYDTYQKEIWIQSLLPIFLYQLKYILINNEEFQKGNDGLEPNDHNLVSEIDSLVFDCDFSNPNNPNNEFDIQQYLTHDSFKRKLQQLQNLAETLITQKCKKSLQEYHENGEYSTVNNNQIYDKNNHYFQILNTAFVEDHQNKNKIQTIEKFFNNFQQKIQEEIGKNESTNQTITEWKQQCQHTNDEITIKGDIKQSKQIRKIYQIDYFQQRHALMIKVCFSDMTLSIESSDEVNFSTQLICVKSQQIQIDIDDNRRITAKVTQCLGYGSKIMESITEMFDLCMIAATCYFDYYYSNIMMQKTIRDTHKFQQLQDEIEFLSNKYKFEKTSFMFSTKTELIIQKLINQQFLGSNQDSKQQQSDLIEDLEEDFKASQNGLNNKNLIRLKKI